MKIGLTAEQLEATLREMLPMKEMTVEVGKEAGGGLVGLVLSPEYADVEDHERQSQIWMLLAERYGDEVAYDVEFVHTLTPEEHTDLMRQAAEEDYEDATTES